MWMYQYVACEFIYFLIFWENYIKETHHLGYFRSSESINTLSTWDHPISGIFLTCCFSIFPYFSFHGLISIIITMMGQTTVLREAIYSGWFWKWQSYTHTHTNGTMLKSIVTFPSVEEILSSTDHLPDLACIVEKQLRFRICRDRHITKISAESSVYQRHVTHLSALPFLLMRLDIISQLGSFQPWIFMFLKITCPSPVVQG